MRALLRRGVERHPLLWAALLPAAAVLAADALPGRPLMAGAGAVSLIVLFLAALASGLRLRAAAFLALALAAGGLHAGRVQRQTRALAEAQRHLEALVAIASPPKIAGRGWSALGRTPQDGALWWVRGMGPPPENGETISLPGSFQALPAPRNPGEFDFRDWAWRKGVSGVLAARAPQKTVSAPGWLTRGTSSLRQAFSEAIVRGLDPASEEAAVIRAMVLGDIPPAPELVEPFRTSGTLHAFSVSGMHVAMLGGIGWAALRLAGVRRRYAVPVLAAGMAGYVWITGMSPPAVRSLTMATVVLAGFALRRRGSLENVLGLALLAAIFTDGHLIFQAGVQLSFGVVAAIAFLSPLCGRPFRWLAWQEPYLPRQLYTWAQERWLRFRQRSADSLGMSTAAMLGSAPLLVLRFGLLSPVSILASVVMGFPIFLLMALAFLSAALSFAPPVSVALNRLNGHVAGFCLEVAKKASALPGGHFQIPLDRPGKDFLLVYDPADGGGAAILHDAGKDAIFDCGRAFTFGSLLRPSMEHLAVAPQTLFLSHPDGGHIGGAIPALDALPLRQVILPVEKARSPAFRDLLPLLDQRGIPHPLGRAGGRYELSPSATVEILHVAPASLTNAVADERVMVWRLEWRGWRILFTSDTGWTEERAMLKEGLDLSADVIVMGRHANDSSCSDAFLTAVHPQVIVASHADFPAPERIPPQWQAACEARGIQVFHQGKTGAVTLVPKDDGTLEIRGYMNGETRVLRRR